MEAFFAVLASPFFAQSIFAAVLGVLAHLTTHATWPSLRLNEPGDKTLTFGRLSYIIGVAIAAGIIGAFAVDGKIDLKGWLDAFLKLFQKPDAVSSVAEQAAAATRYNLYLVECTKDGCATQLSRYGVESGRLGLFPSEFLAIAALTYVALDGPALLEAIKDALAKLTQSAKSRD